MDQEVFNSVSSLFDGLLDSMTNMVDVKPLARIMLYGNPGAGKTVLGMKMAQSLRKDGQILYIDTAQGFTTLAMNERWQYLTENTKRLPFDGVRQLNVLAEAINSDERFNNFTVIVIDETNTVAERDLALVARLRVKEKKSSDPNEVSWPDRNISYNRVKEMITNLQDLNIHIIHLAHARIDKDSVNIEITQPSFGPSQVSPILAPLQLVGFVHTIEEKGKQLEYRIQCRESRQIIAKTQFDQLGKYATYDEVIEAVAAFSDGKVNTQSIVEFKDDIAIVVN